MGKSRHYEVVYRMNTKNGIRPQRASRLFYRLEDARAQAERLERKNEYFFEVDGFTPFISDVHIIQVDTTIWKKPVS